MSACKSRMHNEESVCCSVLSKFVCLSSEFHEICMKYVFNLSRSPTGQKQGPSSSHKLTRTPTQRYNVAPWPYTDECVSFRAHRSQRKTQSERGNEVSKIEEESMIDTKKWNLCVVGRVGGRRNE